SQDAERYAAPRKLTTPNQSHACSRRGAGKSERRSNVAARRLKSSKSPVFVTFFDKLAVMKILVTGSSGLIGSEAVEHFDGQGHEVFGVDNNMRRLFFGAAGDTLWNLERLKNTAKRFTHRASDIRDRVAIEELFGAQRFDLIVHCAAQPSHDKAGEIPLLDFEV